MAYACERSMSAPHFQLCDLPSWTAAIPSTKDRSKLAEIFTGLNGTTVISTKMRDVLEQLEPGAHQIAPIHVRFKNGSRPEAPYFVLNVTQHIDSIIDELSSVRTHKNPGGLAPSRDVMEPHPPSSRDLKMDAATAKGYHLSRETRYPYEWLLISNELHGILKRSKMRAFQLWRVKERKS